MRPSDRRVSDPVFQGKQSRIRYGIEIRDPALFSAPKTPFHHEGHEEA
jgi:hypothetical protein